MSKYNDEKKDEKFFNVPQFDLKKLWSHPNFYQDFRQVKMNWALIVLGLAFTVFLLLTDGTVFTYQGKFYIKLGFPLMVVFLVILIVIQGEWQKFDEDRQIVDIVIYLIFIITGFLMYAFYDPFLASTMILVVIFTRRYLANRENRLAQVMRE